VSDVHETACRHGAADVNLLFFDRRPVAFLYNYLLDGNLQTAWMGSHPDVNVEDALSLLVARMIQDSFERGDGSIDLGLGSLAFAHGAQTSVVTYSRLLHFSMRSFRGHSAKLRHWMSRHGTSELTPAGRSDAQSYNS
jgi:hypothetical protein